MSGQYKLAWLCEALLVSRSGYYDWVQRRRQPGARQLETTRLRERIRNEARVLKNAWKTRRGGLRKNMKILLSKRSLNQRRTIERRLRLKIDAFRKMADPRVQITITRLSLRERNSMQKTRSLVTEGASGIVSWGQWRIAWANTENLSKSAKLLKDRIDDVGLNRYHEFDGN
jgi:hypothetical protein